jgi:hypothetical protein
MFAQWKPRNYGDETGSAASHIHANTNLIAWRGDFLLSKEKGFPLNPSIGAPKVIWSHYRFLISQFVWNPH